MSANTRTTSNIPHIPHTYIQQHLLSYCCRPSKTLSRPPIPHSSFLPSASTPQERHDMESDESLSTPTTRRSSRMLALEVEESLPLTVDDDDASSLSEETPSTRVSRNESSSPSNRWWIRTVVLAASVLVVLYVHQHSAVLLASKHAQGKQKFDPPPTVWDGHMIPPALWSLYNRTEKGTDLTNKAGVIPPFWKYPNNNNNRNISKSLWTWGPCYRPRNWQTMDWNRTLQRQKWRGDTIPYRPTPDRGDEVDPTLYGLCRPGFLILGAGKCGTSSLYHYLTQHPQILPAKQKQIHYFKYHSQQPLAWYYSWFPPTASFLARGAWMTGEASPGYLPYPNVVHQIQQLWYARKTAAAAPPPKLIVVGRNPLARTWSSYKYNYVRPTLAALRQGKYVTYAQKRNQSQWSDEELAEEYLFSFQDLIVAELEQLQSCFQGTNAQDLTWKRHKSKAWARQAMAADPATYYASYDDSSSYAATHSSNASSSFLIDLDGVCYGTEEGKVYAKGIPRIQWKTLLHQHPTKILPNRNVQLTQSLVGRSLYVLPLAWWMQQMQQNNVVHFVCTEDLHDTTVLHDLATNVLGVPEFDFSNVIAQGDYNVGNHPGYDEISNVTNNRADEQEIPLSDSIKQRYWDFVRPFNQQLFDLVGKTCSEWDP